MSKLDIKNHKKSISAIAIIFLLFIGHCVYTWLGRESTDNAYIEAEISQVSAEVNGIVSEIFVENNKFVEKGQKIAQIESQKFKARLDQAKSSINGAERKIEISKSEVKLATIKQNQLEERYKFAKDNFEQADKNYARIKELSKDKFASVSRLDSTRLAWQKAQNELTQAKLELDTSKENLKLLSLKELAAKDALESSRAALVIAEQDMDNTLITAPVSGVMGNSAIKVGNYVVPGMLLFSIIPSESLHVKANFKETQIKNIRKGMKAMVVIDGFSHKTLYGTVRNFAPATNSKFSLLPSANATGNFTKIVQRVPVIIDLKLPKDIQSKVVPGMSVYVRIDVN